MLRKIHSVGKELGTRRTHVIVVLYRDSVVLQQMHGEPIFLLDWQIALRTMVVVTA